MRISGLRAAALAAGLLWVCTACVSPGGPAAVVDQSELVGAWSSPTGAHLYLGADRTMSGTSMKKGLLGGTHCPDVVAGRWIFFTAPNEHGGSFGDETLTSGDTIALDMDAEDDPCLLSALIREDDKGVSLCLVEDPDSDCSAEELLRKEPDRA
ncbi:hypothetical protein [Streptomyces sp. NBC_01465]|uniref:hypothetical protein n=1 Tax=Streptomyces sp. NBC_01465 TaxID=2903878 RepID=UPI002E3295AF|nr:hypothetical protein [Streptomyces sp. NBC_01465]